MNKAPTIHQYVPHDCLTFLLLSYVLSWCSTVVVHAVSIGLVGRILKIICHKAIMVQVA